MDGPIALSEVMKWYQKWNQSLLVFKVNFEKAYYSLRWGFLNMVMAEMGFSFKWRRWIKGCSMNACAFILVNDSPTGEFEICRGLHQTDPMPPFLFILTMEGLHGVIQNDLFIGLFKSSYMGPNSFMISHLMMLT